MKFEDRVGMNLAENMDSMVNSSIGASLGQRITAIAALFFGVYYPAPADARTINAASVSSL